jgi:hypothetical protein
MSFMRPAYCEKLIATFADGLVVTFTERMLAASNTPLAFQRYISLNE